jgi:hypothetical protein
LAEDTGFIRKIVLKTGETTTLNPQNKFSRTKGIALAQGDTLAIVSDTDAGVLFTINMQTKDVKHLSGQTRECAKTQFLGSCPSNFRDGNALSAYFNYPKGLAYEATTNSVLVCDALNHAIRRVSLIDGYVTTVVGRYDGCSRYCLSLSIHF